MEFQIDFNREINDNKLKEIGCKLVSTQEYSYFAMELPTFEDFKELMKKVNNGKHIYSAIVNFDPPTIYFEKDI